MKKISIILLLFYASLAAQNDANVMSYYASDNNLDGQPRIDMINVMRFFPVFAIQDSVTNVNITIYYGNNIFDAKADKMAGGKYWQTMLPDFKLGDAIQRVEVAMEFSLPKIYSAILDSLNKAALQKSRLSDSLKQEINNSQIMLKKAGEQRSELIESVKANRRKIQDLIKVEGKQGKITYGDMVNITNKLFLSDSTALIDFNITKVKKILDTLIENVTFLHSKVKAEIDTIKSSYIDLLENKNPREDFFELLRKRYENTTVIDNLNQQIKDDKDTLRKCMQDFEKYKIDLEIEKGNTIEQMVDEIAEGYTDSLYSGPAIKKSDLRISDNLHTAILLYRYYKNNLRYRKALDPAEHLGIFRARYIPFPVAGTPSEGKVQLLAPMQTGSPAVFEVGLSFGDDVVSGNNTFNPAFSVSRLGVAMVITEKLFSSDAQILGLALTYDFNSYASIGVGRNLAQGKSYPYYSFGINKKAFEQLIKALAGLFD